jgi:hypothetical protein
MITTIIPESALQVSKKVFLVAVRDEDNWLDFGFVFEAEMKDSFSFCEIRGLVSIPECNNMQSNIRRVMKNAGCMV